MAVATKLTSKGQVTIPKSVRDRLGLRPGDAIEFVEEDHGYRLQKHLAESPFEKYVGYLSDIRRHDSDEMVREMRGE